MSVQVIDYGFANELIAVLRGQAHQRSGVAGWCGFNKNDLFNSKPSIATQTVSDLIRMYQRNTRSKPGNAACEQM